MIPRIIKTEAYDICPSREHAATQELVNNLTEKKNDLAFPHAQKQVSLDQYDETIECQPELGISTTSFPGSEDAGNEVGISSVF